MMMIVFEDDSTRFLFLPCDIFMTISYENAQEGEKKSLVLVRGGNKMHITPSLADYFHSCIAKMRTLLLHRFLGTYRSACLSKHVWHDKEKKKKQSVVKLFILDHIRLLGATVFDRGIKKRNNAFSLDD